MRPFRQHSVFATSFAVLALACIMAAVAACGGSNSKTSPTAANQSPYDGIGISPNVPRPALVLNDTSGQPYDLKKQTDGQLTLVYVGYTHCPDICPTLMADIAATLKAMPADQAAKVKVVFITSDPDRDTGSVLRKWLDVFNTSFIGLVPTQAQLAAVTTALIMPPIQKEDTGTANYGVSHAAYVMAFTQDNLSHLVYPEGVTRDDWAHDIPKLLAEGWKGK
jgi:protein SCO1